MDKEAISAKGPGGNGPLELATAEPTASETARLAVTRKTPGRYSCIHMMSKDDIQEMRYASTYKMVLMASLPAGHRHPFAARHPMMTDKG